MNICAFLLHMSTMRFTIRRNLRTDRYLSVLWGGKHSIFRLFVGFVPIIRHIELNYGRLHAFTPRKKRFHVKHKHPYFRACSLFQRWFAQFLRIFAEIFVRVLTRWYILNVRFSEFVYRQTFVFTEWSVNYWIINFVFQWIRFP